jgi:histidinol-phosphate aminotransferase
MIPLTRSHPNLIVARTFSKIYGMAGLRAGYGIANAEVIKTLRRVAAWDSMNVMALVAARASLADSDHLARGRMRNATAKQELVARLAENGYEVIPSEANFVMIDLRRDVKPVIAAMRDRGVRVGRLFPAMPHHLRVTIGTPAEMARFIEVFREVMA